MIESEVAAFAVAVEEVDGNDDGYLYHRDDDETSNFPVADEIRPEYYCHREKI